MNQVQNAGKSSRAGTRAARIVRIVRLVRLMRIAKLYKHARNAIQSDSIEKIADEEDLQIPKESRVGKKLSDIITKPENSSNFVAFCHRVDIPSTFDIC